MMLIQHPTNPKFALFHLIGKSWQVACHIWTILKLAELYAHAMILVLLPFLQWNLQRRKGEHVALIIAKWFKPAVWARATDDP